MINQIKKFLSDGFEKDLLNASFENLKAIKNPLRFNNFAYSLRELVRHVLTRLSPDKNILKCPWYTNETDKKDGITRKQRAYYAVQGGLDDEYVKNELEIEVDEIHSDLIKAINELSKYTHIGPKTFDLPPEKVDELTNETLESVLAFLKTIENCKKSITDTLWEHIDSAVVDETLRETILSIDHLATHHFIDEVYTGEIIISSIDHEFIYFQANGSIGCELQWGSNSDLKKGDGAILPQSFPFICELISPIEAPDEVETIEDSLCVDTSSWEDNFYGE